MRIAVVADSHFDQHSRFEECIRLHEAIARDATKRGVTLTLHAGDLFERKSTPDERHAAFGWLQQMAQLGPLIAVRGNHDELGNLPLAERLDSHHPIIVVEGARVVRMPCVAVAAVAWPRKAALLAAVGAESSEAGERSAGDALRGVFRGLGAELDAFAGTRLLLMHAMVRGSLTSAGQPLVGADLEVGLDDLALVGADAYLLGHIHRGQEWRIGNAPCVYPGSPRRTAFGEIEAKGYTLVTADGRDVTAEFIELPATPMVHISATWSGVALASEDVDVAGAEVRLRFTTNQDQRDGARVAAEQARQELLAAGAISVKLEEIVIAEQRARAPELAKAVTLEDKLEALWRAKNWDPGDRRSALISKLRDLQESDHAA
jgi:exonuclease SbcD